MQSSIEIPASLLNLDKTILKAVEKSVEDCTADLFRVAQARTPVDSTTLEKSGTSKVAKEGNAYVGRVSFKAMNKGFNYAKQMDKAKYKLGKKSLLKSSRGVRSKFSKQSFQVGSGYLTDTAEKCTQGYEEYVNYKIYEALAKDGFKVFEK